MDSFKRYWKNVPSAIRKPLIFIIGIFVVTVGLAMLLLPGPGWLVIFLGLALLATEFAVAEKVRAWAVGQLQIMLKRSKRTIKNWFKPSAK